MNYKKESQFTNNASKRVFEEAYIDEDMPNESANPSTGVYMLRVPEMFATDLSQEKAISPRRVMCEPKPHTFVTRVKYFDPSTSAALATTNFVSFDFTTSNTLEECLNHMRDNFKISVTVGNDEEEEGDEAQTIAVTYGLYYNFDKINGVLRLWAIDSQNTPVDFRFECLNYDEYNSIWQLFNQTGNPFYSAQDDRTQYNTNVLAPQPGYQMINVWSREPLYVHASFSSSKKHYLCRTGDFWFKPSKYYYDNIANNEFFIHFTTDGSHFIIPYDAIKVIELCFILRQFARL